MKKKELEELTVALLRQQELVRPVNPHAEEDAKRVARWHEEEKKQAEEAERQKKKRIDGLLAMGTPALQRELELRYQMQVIAKLDKIEEIVDGMVNELARHLICQALGLENHWSNGEWRPRSNEGTLVRRLGVRVMRQLELAVPDFIAELTQGSDREMQRVKAGFRRCYREALDEALKTKIESTAQAAAERSADWMVLAATVELPENVRPVATPVVFPSKAEPGEDVDPDLEEDDTGTV